MLLNTINKIRANNFSTNNVIGILIWAIGAEKVKLFTELCKSFAVSYSINLCQMWIKCMLFKSFFLKNIYLSLYLDSCCSPGLFIQSYLIAEKGPNGTIQGYMRLAQTHKSMFHIINKQQFVIYTSSQRTCTAHILAFDQEKVQEEL